MLSYTKDSLFLFQLHQSHLVVYHHLVSQHLYLSSQSFDEVVLELLVPAEADLPAIVLVRAQRLSRNLFAVPNRICHGPTGRACGCRYADSRGLTKSQCLEESSRAWIGNRA